MPAWNGAETADIVYDDVGGEFTDLLYDLGHLSGDPFRVKRYYIEVKTTTGACGTRFFMSKAQYRRVSLGMYVEMMRCSGANVILNR